MSEYRVMHFNPADDLHESQQSIMFALAKPVRVEMAIRCLNNTRRRKKWLIAGIS